MVRWIAIYLDCPGTQVGAPLRGGTSVSERGSSIHDLRGLCVADRDTLDFFYAGDWQLMLLIFTHAFVEDAKSDQIVMKQWNSK